MILFNTKYEISRKVKEKDPAILGKIIRSLNKPFSTLQLLSETFLSKMRSFRDI